MRPQDANLKPAKPGKIRNPAGRPKGSRNKLGEAFLQALYEDWQTGGVAAIQKVRDERPHEYFKVIAGLLSKELHVKDASLDDMTDDELTNTLAAVRSLVASGLAAEVGKRAKAKAGEKELSPVRTVN